MTGKKSEHVRMLVLQEGTQREQTSWQKGCLKNGANSCPHLSREALFLKINNNKYPDNIIASEKSNGIL